MRKKDELALPDSCLNKAGDEEIIFVLRAKDAAAPAAILFWIGERQRLGLNGAGDEKLKQAARCAATMEEQRTTTPKGERPMPLTCAQRVAALTEAVHTIYKRIVYNRMQLDFTLAKIAAIKAIVCSPPPSGCCQTITEFESAHPTQDLRSPALDAMWAVFAAIEQINCESTTWKMKAYEAMELLEAANAALGAYDVWVDLWIGFLAALSDQGCAIVLDPMPQREQ